MTAPEHSAGSELLFGCCDDCNEPVGVAETAEQARSLEQAHRDGESEHSVSWSSERSLRTESSR